MPNWKKLIASGSDASLNSLNVNGGLTAGGTITANSFNGNFSGTIGNNLISANQLNVTGNGTTSQFLRSDGDGTFTWATPTNTNYFLNGITKSGNTLTFSVSGTTNRTYTFGSNAFTSYSNHVGLYDSAGSADAVNTRIDEEVLPAIPTNNNQLTNGAGYITSYVNTQRSDEEIRDVASAQWINGTNTTVVKSDSGNTIKINSVNTNTTYSAGTGLTLSGTTFSLSSTYDNYVKWQVSDGITNTNVASGDRVTFIGDGATNISYDADAKTFTISSTDTNTDTNTTYSAGGGLSLSGTTFSHTDTSSQGSVNNSGRTYIQDITLDTYGHITGITSATETVVNTDTNTQRSDEEIRDVASAQWINGTNTTVVKSDSGNTIKINSVNTNTQRTDAEIREVTKTQLVEGDNVTLSVEGDTIIISSTDTNTTYSVGDGGLTQKNFTTTLFNKLNGIAASANNYSLPEATSTVRGGIELFSNTDQAVAANTVSATAGRTYGIQLNSAGQAVVNVPWSDTNTNTNYFLNGITKSGNTLTFSVSGTTNRTYTFGSNAFTSYSNHVGLYDSIGSADVVNTRIDDEVLPAIPTNNNQLTNGAGYQTSTQVNTAIQSVVDAAPAALDTLNEIAASLNDDSDFAGTMTTALAGKLSTTGKAADSNLLDGLDLGGTRANVANKVVRTDSSGYLNAGWINTTSGATTSTITDFFVNTGDGYIRKSTPAHVKSQLGLGSAAYVNTSAFDSAGTGAAAADAVNSRIDSEVLPAIPTNNNQLTNGAGYTTNTGTMSSWIIKEGNGTETTTVTNGETLTIAQGTGIQSELTSTSSGGTLTITNTAPDQTVSLTGAGATSISGTYPNFTITSTDTNTDTNTVTSIRRDNTGTYRTGNINLVGGSNVTITETSAGVFSFASTDTNTNTTYSAGNGISLSGTTFSVAAGGGLTQTSTGLAHTDTSSQSSVNNSGNTVIQDVTLDTYGHVTGLASATITLSSLGFTGATNANYITNNNQLSNGAGYLTSTNDRVYITDSRGAVRLPSYYDDRYAQWDFQNAADTEAGGDEWQAIQTISKWSSFNSSHRQEQLIFTGDNLKRRTAESDTAWGELKTVWDSGNLNALTNASVSNDTITFTKADGSTFAVTTSDADTNTWRGIHDSPVNGATTTSISSNWAFDNVKTAVPANAVFTDTDTNTQRSDEEIRDVAAAQWVNGTNTTVVKDDTNNTIKINSTNTNTTYSAGTGLTLSGTTFSLTNTYDNYDYWWLWVDGNQLKKIPSAAGVNFKPGSNVSVTHVEEGEFDSVIISATDTNTTYSAGSGLSLSGTTFSHSDTSSQGSVNNSGRTYIQDITLDTYGHITGITSATETVVNTDTNTTYSADGNYGMTLSGTTFRLEDDRRRNSTTTDIYTGNTHDFTFYDASVGIRWYTAGSEDMRLLDNGTLHVDGDVVAYSTTVSDERLKDNVTTIQNPLDKIKALRGVEYDWNAGNRKGKRDLGLIAQEVEMVIPEIVHEHELPLIDGESDTIYKTVDYEKMVAVLIEGMKEQQSQIDELKSEISKLKGEA